MNILIGILTLILILVSIFLVLVVLAQKSKSDGGVGAALGGGMTEATFGADTGNVLTKATINASIAFFVLSFVLFLAHVYNRNAERDSRALPAIAEEVEAEAEAPAAPATPELPAFDDMSAEPVPEPAP